MEEKYTKAFKEVYVILNNSSKEEYDKIPRSFIELIEKNMDVNYNPEIQFDENFENSVLEETLLILALIYRDFLISKEERKALIEQEEKQLEELNESYDIEKLFKKRQQVSEESVSNIEQHLTVIKEEKWYKKILNKILNIFKH